MPRQTRLDRYRAAIEGGTFSFPFSELIGFELVEVEPGVAVVELDAGERHFNPIGTLHGGVTATLADTAMGIAHASLLDEAAMSTTVELKVNYLRAFQQGKLRAVGRAVKHGRTLTYLECDVTGPDGTLIARANCTCMTLEAPPL